MLRIFLILVLFFNASQAQAEFIISSAIVDFGKGSPKQQDIELISRSKDNDYIVTQMYEVLNPGTSSETHKLLKNTEDSGLLVTPDKMILPGGGRKIVRIVMLENPTEKDRIYRVIIKPVIRDVEAKSKLALKVLVGYEALVIVRAAEPVAIIKGERKGNSLTLKNDGNTNILLQSGTQCKMPAQTEGENCKPLPLSRIYAGGKTTITLPFDAPATYFIWDGQELTEYHF